jgi:hypothetical protein
LGSNTMPCCQKCLLAPLMCSYQPKNDVFSFQRYFPAPTCVFTADMVKHIGSRAPMRLGRSQPTRAATYVELRAGPYMCSTGTAGATGRKNGKEGRMATGGLALMESISTGATNNPSIGHQDRGQFRILQTSVHLMRLWRKGEVPCVRRRRGSKCRWTAV